MLFARQKPASHETRVLAALKKAGHYGVYNYELAKPNVGGICFNRRINDLREDGYGISCHRVKQGTFKYYLVSEPEEI